LAGCLHSGEKSKRNSDGKEGGSENDLWEGERVHRTTNTRKTYEKGNVTMVPATFS